MPRKTRWIITLFTLLLLGGLFVLRAAIFEWISPRQVKLENLDLIAGVITGIGGVIALLFGFGKWLLGADKKDPPANRLDEILIPTSPDKLFETYVVPARVKGQVLPWIDTGRAVGWNLL
jgi:hypothetical protein